MLFCLYLKSPNALVKLRPPLTLPLIIWPPAYVILLYSSGLYGLWSYDNRYAVPFLDRTARESPQFAVMILFGVINTTLAVHPQFTDILLFAYDPSKFFFIKLNCSSPYLLPINSSTFLNASIIAYLYRCYLYALLVVKWLTNNFYTSLDTYGPNSLWI